MRVNKIKKRDKNAKKEDDPRIFMWYILKIMEVKLLLRIILT